MTPWLGRPSFPHLCMARPSLTWRRLCHCAPQAGSVLSQCFVQSYDATSGEFVNYCTATIAFGNHGSITWLGPFPDLQVRFSASVPCTLKL